MQGPHKFLGDRSVEGGKALGQHGPGEDERPDLADMERTVSQPLTPDLALQQLCAAHLHVRLESLLRGPALGLLSVTGQATGQTRGRKARGRRGLRERRKGPGCGLDGGGDMVVVAVRLCLSAQDVKRPQCGCPTSVGTKRRHYVPAIGEIVVTENRVP